MSETIEDLFAQYAAKSDADSRSSNRSYHKDYPDIEWTGLELGVPKVLRMLGNPPDTHTDAFTSRVVTVAWLTGDDGKKFKVIRPSFAEDPNYILNRIIQKVKSVKWVDGNKTFPIKDKCPDIYNIVDKNGLKSTDSKYKYEKGWNGRELLIANVIDRAQMEWHKSNKHTMLLAKSITNVNGSDFVDEGVSSFATLPKIKQLFKYYGSWEKYDIAITRTGDLNNAFIIENASKNPERVPGGESIISFETKLTDEESSWERYDLDKIYRYTTSTKIYNRLKNTIRKIDLALGTSFLKDLEYEVEKEKKLWDEIYKEEEDILPVFDRVEEAVETPAPARTRAVVETSNGGAPGSNLPYYSTLSDVLKGKIKSAVKVGNKWNIEWDYPVEELASCPEPDCGAVSPLEATECPCCGCKF